MSIVKSKRGNNVLNVLNYAEDLLEYTFQICHRTKTVQVNGVKEKAPVIPQKYWYSLTSKIIEDAESAYIELFKANTLFLGPSTTIEEFNERRLHQKKAVANLKSLAARVTFVWHKFGIKANSVEYWANLIIKTLQATTSWIKSDDLRFRSSNHK